MNWINVKSELPNQDEDVLVWAKGDWHYAVYCWSHHTESMEFELPLNFHACQASHKDVTHWARVEGLK